MQKNGKLVDIRKATKQMVINALVGEHEDKGYRSNTLIKFDAKGGFKMVYEYRKPDEYSKLIGATIPGIYYKRIVSGTYKLIEANYKRFNNFGNVQPTNRYGEPVTDILYVKYYIVLTGKDDQGVFHTVCGEINQRFDDQYMYGWTISSVTKGVENACGCVCETGDAKNREIGMPDIEL